MFIKNLESLAKTPLRRDALLVAEAGLEAISPKNFLPREVRLVGELLLVKKERINLRKYRRIFVIGIGKAALDSAEYLEKILGPRVSGGAVIDTRSKKLKKIKSFLGTHPLPSAQNAKATAEIMKIAKNAKKDDLIIAIISGGGSSLLFKPKGGSITAARRVFSQLLDSGADIEEMNTVRKHISDAHGGNLVRLANPASVLGLVFSDVPFDDPGLVASGPTFLDTTTKNDAQKILSRYGINNISLSETPKDRRIFSRTKNILLLSNADALRAMERKAQSLGYRTFVGQGFVRGEASEVGEELLRGLKNNGEMVVYGGETLVRVTNKNGKGGRNMDVVLGGLSHLKKDQLLLSIASDGVDNIVDAAGALADRETLRKATESGLDPGEFLLSNNSYSFFRRVGGAIRCGKTGSNVSDLMLVAQKKSKKSKK
jgi:glycerate-2-kinase